MKSSLIVIALLIFALTSVGQETSAKEKKAFEAYKGFSYSIAMEKYEEIGVTTIEQKRILAQTYWKLDSLNRAEKLFAEVVLEQAHSADDIYDYASVLRQNKKYSQSDEWMVKFSEMNGTDSRGIAYVNKIGYYEELQKNKDQFVIENLEVNSEQQDFGAIYYKDQIAFASSREGTKSILRRWNWNQLPFLDIYLADYENGNLKNPKIFHKKLNKKYHDGPLAFSKEGDFMVFTRNNYTEKSEDNIVRLKLFSSRLIDGEWSKPEPLPYNSSAYSCGHASISGDTKWIYFASDMPGGVGGVDIYKAPINEDGTFGEAVNMGREINTEGNELFPFIHPTNEMLFFSSDGKVGLGGLDVFVAQIKSDYSIGKVANVGVPINSNRDDFSFVLNEEMSSGFFSSNREGGKGDDDIYTYLLEKPFTFGVKVNVLSKDENNNLISGINLRLLDGLGGDLGLIQEEDENGVFFILPPSKGKYKIIGAKDDYLDALTVIEIEEGEEEVDAVLRFEKEPSLSLYALITDKSTNQPLEGVKITITDNLSGAIEKIITPNTGDYLRPLTDKKLNDTGSYNLNIEKEGYLGKVLTYTALFDRDGTYSIHTDLDLSLEPIALGGDLSKIIDINPIYFDLSKHFIRPDAAIELDKIVKVMNENPKMVIELRSHTDSRGSDKSNESLSDRRAKSSASYIAARISNSERIYGKGFGEYKPNSITLEDGTEIVLTEEYINSFKVSNSKKYKELHQMNRRTEFIIIEM